MPAALDCQSVAQHYLDWVREEARRLPFVPRLAALLHRPTADAASIQYRDLLLKDAARVGLAALPVEASEPGQVAGKIRELNADPGVHGVIVLYPLRCGLADEDVMDIVSPYKDAEGLHSINMGYLIKYKKLLDAERGLKCVVPATPKAVVKSLQSRPELAFEGRFAAIVNNSMRVGKPLGLMLENLGATVVKCYDRTRREDLEHCVRRADILVTAVPDPGFRLDPSWIKPGAVVIDVSHQGNLDTSRLGQAALVTAPENGLGKVTRAMILVNLIYCARYRGVFY